MRKQIIKNRQIIEDDWTHLDENDALPESGNVTISYARWQEEKNNMLHFKGELGIALNTDVAIDKLKDNLHNIALITINFTEFKDGRGFSLARLLRERYQFDGEIRATGNVLRDQIYYLHRCGFDAFELEPHRDINEAMLAFDDFSVNYQPAVV